MIQKNDTYLDFRTRIRNAKTHEEAENILRDLTPQSIRKTIEEVVLKQGEDGVFENDEFYLSAKNREFVLARKTTGGQQTVFQSKGRRIIRFVPFRCWNVLNFLKEIADKGQIEI